MTVSAQFTAFLSLLGYAVLITQAVVTFAKGGFNAVPPVKARPTLYTFCCQATALTVGTVITFLLAVIFSHVAAPSEVLLSLLIGVAVGFAAMGHYEVLAATLKNLIKADTSLASPTDPTAPVSPAEPAPAP